MLKMAGSGTNLSCEMVPPSFTPGHTESLEKQREVDHFTLSAEMTMEKLLQRAHLSIEGPEDTCSTSSHYMLAQ